MNSPSSSLLWETWLRNRWTLLVTGIAFAFCGTLSQVAAHLTRNAGALTEAVPTPLVRDAADQWRNLAESEGIRLLEEQADLALQRAAVWRSAASALAPMSFIACVLLLFGGLAGVEPSPLRGFTGIPPRKFVLPVTVTRLIIGPIALGSVGLVVLWYVWWWVVLQPLSRGFEVRRLYLALLLAAGFVWFLALVWGLASFSRVRAVLLTALVVALACLAALGFDSVEFIAAHPALDRWLPVATGVAWALGCGAAWFGVRTERRGGCGEPTCVRTLPLKLAAFSRPGGRFASPLRAQLWIEWRRNVRLPLLVWLGGLLLLLAFPLWAHPHDSPVANPGESIIWIGALAWCAFVGLNLGRDATTKTPALSAFAGTLPIGPERRLAAKVLAGLAAWLAMWASFLGVAVLWTMAAGAAASLTDSLVPIADGWFRWLTLALISLHVMVGTLPLNLTGRLPGFPWSLLPLLAAYWLLIPVLTWVKHRSGVSDALVLALLLGLALAVKLSLATGGFFWCCARRLVSWRYPAISLAVWCAGAILALAPAITNVLHESDPVRAMMWTLGLPLIVPLARIAWAPAALTANRHR